MPELGNDVLPNYLICSPVLQYMKCHWLIKGLFKVLHRLIQLTRIICTLKSHLLEFIHITQYILPAVPNNMAIWPPPEVIWGGQHSHHELQLHRKVRCSPNYSSQGTWEKFFLLSKEIQVLSFCKACNMKNIPCQHGSINEYKDKWKMFKSCWTKVK